MKTLREYINIVEGGVITDAWFKNGAFKTSKKPNPVPYKIADSDGFTRTLEGPVKHRKGHYIMGPGPKREFWPLEPDNFNDKYDDNGDGTGTPKGGVIKLAKLADHDGIVKASWGNLEYTKGNDYIVRHGENDYGVVKKDIFAQTYEKV